MLYINNQEEGNHADRENKEKAMNRLNEYINKMLEDMTEQELAAALGNGDIDRPEWLSGSESTDHVKLWDNEDQTTGPQMGFVTLDYYGDEDDSE